MASAAISAWFLLFARVGGMLAALPMFSMRTFPVQIRIGLGALIAILLVPIVPIPNLELKSIWALAGLLATELSVGLLLGFICRFVFFALEIAGGFIATEMGLLLPQEFSQLTDGSAMAPAVALYWLALMLLFSLDLHLWMIAAFQKSYALIPAGGGVLSEGLLITVIKKSGFAFQIALQIAAPVMAVSFVVTLVFALLSRAVPQMNVFAESFPVRTLVGLLTFGLTFTFVGHYLANYLRRIPEDMLTVARLVGG